MPRKLLRDLFFGAAGSAIAYHEFWLEEDPSPIGAFMVLFLWGLIPAFRAEDANAPSPLAVLLQFLTASKASPASPDTPEGGREDQADRAAQADREEAPEAKAAPEAKGDRPGKQKPSRRPSRDPDS